MCSDTACRGPLPSVSQDQTYPLCHLSLTCPPPVPPLVPHLSATCRPHVLHLSLCAPVSVLCLSSEFLIHLSPCLTSLSPLSPVSSCGDPDRPSSRDSEQQHLADHRCGRPRPAGPLHHRHPLLEAVWLREAGVPAGCHQHDPAEAEGQRSTGSRLVSHVARAQS